MRKLLLNSTAIATVAALTSGAAMADVSVSAATEWKYNNRSSQVEANDGSSFSQDSEIKFSFSNKTDSGLVIGYAVEMESDEGGADTVAIDESSLSISGGFGKIVLGQNDGVGDNYGIGAEDIIAEEDTPAVGSSSIGGNADIALADGDKNKIAYHLPAMGGLTIGGSFQNSGTNKGADTTQVGAQYAMTTNDIAVTIGGATATTEVKGFADTDSRNVGIKVVSGSITFSVSQSEKSSANDDIDNKAAAVSYKMANGMTIGAYTFKSEDSLDTSEEYSSKGVELIYTVAAGLTAVINVDDYEYTAATVNAAGTSQAISQADTGTNSKLTLKASF